MVHSYRAAIAISLAVCALCGCATATPYQPETRGQGYGEQKLEDNRYRVRFTGNSATPRETVENYLLYRAAEITLFNGCDYFVIAQRSTETDPRGRQPDVNFGFGFGSFGSSSGVSLGIGTSTGLGRSDQYSAEAEVLIYKGTPPEGQPNSFDARQIKVNLDSSIQRVAG
jgi:hypothetical protein